MKGLIQKIKKRIADRLWMEANAEPAELIPCPVCGKAPKFFMRWREIDRNFYVTDVRFACSVACECGLQTKDFQVDYRVDKNATLKVMYGHDGRSDCINVWNAMGKGRSEDEQ